jgi:serine/threonine protein kinase
MPPRVAPSIARFLALPAAERRLGPFTLVQQLGHGGFAPVWLARETYAGIDLRTVALKLYALDGAGSGGTDAGQRQARREQVLAEARALCRVEHPNIVRFFSIASDDAGSLLGIAMEHVNGTPVDERIAQTGALPLAQTLAVGCAVASALSAVHQVGLVHCDVKPANVIDALGVFKLIDFGIAAAAPARIVVSEGPAASTTSASQRTEIVDDLPLEIATVAPNADTVRAATSASTPLSGTLGYVDPECVRRAAPPTSASDLYALGAMLFECATGVLPAVAAAKRAGEAGIRIAVLDGLELPPSLGDVAPLVPAPFARLVDQLLAPERSNRPRSAEAVAWELERIRRDTAGRSRPLPTEERGPFRGLGRYEEGDRDVYFGRSGETAAALEMLRSRGLVALVGASGSGKSSLARAGLLPAVADGELGGWPKEWDAFVAAPGEDPRAALGAALDSIVPGAAQLDADALVARLVDAAAERRRGVVLLVDQLEELITLSKPDARAWAVDVLARMGERPLPGVRCIVAARRDLLDALLGTGALGRAIARGTLLVAPLGDAAWEEVLDQALGVYGYALEDAAMRETLLEQLRGTASAMPLVQFALSRLWERRSAERKLLTRAALDDIGGIGGALEAHADASLAALGADAQPVARDVLLALTTAQGTRATRSLSELEGVVASPSAAKVALALLNARLLVSEEGLTLAHEALLVRWGTLRRWLADAREDRLHAEEIAREAIAWERDARAPERLLKGRRLRAANDLAARPDVPLGLHARSFIQASRHAERRASFVRASPLLGFALLAIAVGLFRWSSHRIKESYCETYVERWQVPECVHAVGADEQKHRASTRRFSARDGHVVKVELVNGAGVLRDDADGVASAELRYDDKGRVEEIVDRDHDGRVKLRRTFSDDLGREERRNAFNQPTGFSSDDSVTGEARTSDASVVRYDYDANGFVHRERYFSIFDHPRTDDGGASGFEYTRDARGLWVRADVLGPDGAVTAADEGYARLTRTFDDAGRIVEAAWLDQQNKPAVLAMRIASFNSKFDAYGNETDRRYFDPSGAPATSSWGYAGTTMVYDANGNDAERHYFDRAGDPTLLPDGYAIRKSEYDGRGNATAVHELGVDGKAVLDTNGVSTTRHVYDAHDSVTETHYLDTEGKPTLEVDGNAGWRRTLDERGNETEREFFGVDGAPSAIRGVARIAQRFDERDELIETAFFGVDGEPVESKFGYARVTFSYGENGAEHEVQYFGADGAPVLVQGAARIARQWVDGKNVETAYFGVDGRQRLNAGGFAVEKHKFDARGHDVETEYFATDGHTPALHDGYSRVTFAYDPNERRVGESYFGPDGQPIMVRGYARREAKLDDGGRKSEERYFGVDGRLVSLDAGYARVTWRYDDRNDRIEEAYFAATGAPTRAADGAAGWRAKYDAGGHLVEQSFFDVVGKLAFAKARGYARSTMVDDARGHETERAYFDAAGVPVAPPDKAGAYARTTAAYDARGDEIERAYFAADGGPALHDGYARRLRKVDARGHETEDSYLGLTGQATQGPEGFSHALRAVDPRGDVLDERLFDTSQRPLVGKGGFASTRATFDERGHELERRYFGPDDALVVPYGKVWAHAVSRFDDAGHEVERSYFGRDDKPVLVDGASRWTAEYQHGRATDTRYFGPNGAPIEGALGCPRVLRTFDRRGHLLEVAARDSFDKPALTFDGWASYRSTFDDAGNETERAYFGLDRRLVETRLGFARTISRFDDAGRMKERAWFGADEKPVAVDGVARWVAELDEWGHELSKRWFLADGRAAMKEGFARRTHTYDRHGREIEIAYYDADGRLSAVGTDSGGIAVGRGGWAMRRTAYDDDGRRTRVVYFGADGVALVTDAGFAQVDTRYDEQGREVEERFFDRSGALAPAANGVAVVKLTRDDRGDVVATAFFAPDGKPTLNGDGISGFKSTWDDAGHEIERVQLGLDGAPSAGKKNKWARWRATFDGRGGELELAYFDAAGKGAPGPDGFARRTTTRDAQGREIERAYVDADGKPFAPPTLGYAKLATKLDRLGTPIEADSFDVDGKPARAASGFAAWRATFDGDERETSREWLAPDGSPARTKGAYARIDRTYDRLGRLLAVAYTDEAGKPVVSREDGCALERWSYETSKSGVRACFDATGKRTR